jgi:two-component system sensor histidine kinase AlgZ
LPATAEIPGLTIQPLLENAIYHGIEPSPQPGIISVSGESDGKLIRIAVTNPLPPAGLTSRPGHGLALDNIRERLELAFGPDGTLAVLAGPDRYTVTVTFPANGVRSYA